MRTYCRAALILPLLLVTGCLLIAGGCPLGGSNQPPADQTRLFSNAVSCIQINPDLTREEMSIGQCFSVNPDAFHAAIEGGLAEGSLNVGVSLVDEPGAEDFLALAPGAFFTVALRPDGSLSSWGLDVQYTQGEGQQDSLAALLLTAGNPMDVPTGSDFTAVCAGFWHGVALKKDGSIVAWGNNWFGQCDVPTGKDFIAISAGAAHTLALRADGSIVSWGGDRVKYQALLADLGLNAGDGLAYLPGPFLGIPGISSQAFLDALSELGDPPAGSDFIAISAGAVHNLALRANGSIAQWGAARLGNAPAGTDYVAISAGMFHSLALKADGSIVRWGLTLLDIAQESGTSPEDLVRVVWSGEELPTSEQVQAILQDTSVWNPVPPGNDFVAIAASSMTNAALRADGSLVTWGWTHSESLSENQPCTLLFMLLGGTTTN